MAILETFMDEDFDPHCFVCGRHTDHFGEHDDLVGLGLAVYDEDSVSFTELGRLVKIHKPEIFTKILDIVTEIYEVNVTFKQ